MSDKTSREILNQRTFQVARAGDQAVVVYYSRMLAREGGFNVTDEHLIGTVASELAVNLIRYAKKGKIQVSLLKSGEGDCVGIEIVSQDEGPGFKDVTYYLKEHTTTFKNSLGQGLPSVKRIMDSFHIESQVDKGTRIVTSKWSNK